MDVLDPHKLKADVGVVIFILIAFTSCSVGHGIQLQRGRKINTHRGTENVHILLWEEIASHVEIGYLGPGIHDVDKSAVVIGFADGLQHALILQASRAKPRERLAAPTHRCLQGAETSMQIRPHIPDDVLGIMSQEVGGT